MLGVYPHVTTLSMLYANPFNLSANPEQRTNFGALRSANWAQPYKWARILPEANSLEQHALPYLQPGRVGPSRVDTIRDNETVALKQLEVQRVVDNVQVVRIGKRPCHSVDGGCVRDAVGRFPNDVIHLSIVGSAVHRHNNLFPLSIIWLKVGQSDCFIDLVGGT